MNRKHEQSIYHVNVNVNLMVKNVTRIKTGITVNIGARLKIQKNIVYIFGILLHAVAKMANIQQVLSTIQ